MDYNKVKEKGKSLSYLGGRLLTIEKAIKATAAHGGEVWECGCNRGGTALFMRGLIADEQRNLRCFDTFEGLPFSSEFDVYKVGDMKADYKDCADLFNELPNSFIYKGIMPDTFSGPESSVISVAHIDVDQYQSVKLCLEWIYPRVHVGGWIIIDDYSCGDCPGAKRAVNEFLSGRAERLIVPGAPNPQAHFVKT